MTIHARTGARCLYKLLHTLKYFAFTQCIAIFNLEKLLLSQLPTSIPTSLKLCQLGITLVVIITFELGTSLPIFL